MNLGSAPMNVDGEGGAPEGQRPSLNMRPPSSQGDPWVSQQTDPWNTPSAVQHRSAAAAAAAQGAEQTNPWADWQGPLTGQTGWEAWTPTHLRPRAGQQQRVSQDDELSETRSWSIRSQERQPTGQEQPPLHVGARQPPQQQVEQQQQTETRARITEAQLLRILQGQELTSRTRTEAREPYVPSLHTHSYPMSVAPSLSLRPDSNLGQYRATPGPAPSSMARVTEAMSQNEHLPGACRQDRGNMDAILGEHSLRALCWKRNG